MAMHDWNHNGKKDWQDSYLGYNIYKQSHKNPSSSSQYSGGSTLGAIVGGIIGFLLISGFFSLLGG